MDVTREGAAVPRLCQIRTPVRVKDEEYGVLCFRSDAQTHRVFSSHETEIIEIVDLMIAGLEKRLEEQDMAIELTPAAKALLEHLVDGFDQVADVGHRARVHALELTDEVAGVRLEGMLLERVHQLLELPPREPEPPAQGDAVVQ